MMAAMATKAESKLATGTAEVARSYFEAIGRRDLDAMESHYVKGPVGRIHGLTDLEVGGNYRPYFSNVFRAFPDFKLEIIDLIAEGDKAAVRYRLTGTFSGDARFEGMEPNGAAIDLEGCDVVTVRDGKLVDNQAYLSGTELARQLGALPPQGSGPERAMTAALNLKTRIAKMLGR
jgi:predicted ester cyclase